MANIYYVDNVNGNDQDIAVVGDGVYTHATKTIVKTGAFANAVTGYRIDITGGTNITPGLYKIATNADANTITLVNAPGVDDQTDISIDSNDGNTEAQAFATLARAADAVIAGDTVYVQNTATDYTDEDEAGATTSNVEISTIGTETARIYWRGYTTTISDAGIAIVNAGNTFASCLMGLPDFHTFENFRFTDATGEGLSHGGSSGVLYKNCEIDDHGSKGVHADNGTVFINCEVYNNGTYGIEGDLGLVMIACRIYDNDKGVLARNSLSYGCVYFNNATTNVESFVETNIHGMINCTIDGETVGKGYHGSDAATVTSTPILVNNIIYDLVTGIETEIDYTAVTFPANAQGVAVLNNLFNSNTADATSITTGDDPQTGAPQFTNEAGADYTLASGSPAIDNGYDAGNFV